MLRRKKYLKILAHKPEIFGDITEDVIDGETADQLLQIPRLAVAEIAGPADVQALSRLLKTCKPDGLLPTFSYTGTEYGDWEALGRAADALKQTVQKELRIYVAEPVVLGSPPLWKALRRVHNGAGKARTASAGPCLGCRLYSYMVRVPLCKKVDARFFIPALHGLVQRGCPAHAAPAEKKYFSFLMSGYGIDVWHQDTAITRPDGEAACLSCACAPEPSETMQPEALVRYFEHFALPAAGGILSRAVFGLQADYDEIISSMAQHNKRS